MRTAILTPVEEARPTRRVERDGVAARDEMVARNLPLVRSLAARYVGRGVPFEDLVQEGTVGLVLAVERFDRRRGLKFSTYAVWWIRRSLIDAVGAGRAIRIPPSARQQMAAIRRAEEELRRVGATPATDTAIARRAGLSERTVRALRAVPQVSVSLDQPAGDDGAPLGDLIADGDAPDLAERAERDETSRRVRSLVAVLPARHREVLLRRYGLGGHRVESHAEIAARIGVGEERSRQLEHQALHWLRKLGDGPPPAPRGAATVRPERVPRACPYACAPARACRSSSIAPPAPITMDAAAATSGTTEPVAKPWPRSTYGVVRSSAPTAIAAVNSERRTGETPAA
jgi:RNA polymerase sigma factor (sigma-70 family)